VAGKVKGKGRGKGRGGCKVYGKRKGAAGRVAGK